MSDSHFTIEPGSAGVGGRAGIATHLVGMPGVSCQACQRVWAGQRVIPVLVPPSVRVWKELLDPTPVPTSQFNELAQRVQAAFAAEGIGLPRLRPGDSWPPATVVSPPSIAVDFLWTVPSALIVGQRVAAAVEQLVSCVPFRLEGVARELFYELIPDYAPLLALERIATSCPECGYPDVVDAIPKGPRDGGIFYTGYSLDIGVSLNVKNAIEALHPRNVAWSAVKGVD